MQGFEAKKKIALCIFFPISRVLCTSLLRLLPFHTFVTQVRIEPGCDGRKANMLTTTLRQSQQCYDKLLYLNQMFEKKAMEVIFDCGCLRYFCMTNFYFFWILESSVIQGFRSWIGAIVTT